MRARVTCLFVVFMIIAAGCTGRTDDDGPASYTPIPDQDLFSQIADLPGVINSDIAFNDTFPEHVYVGRVEIEPDMDAQAMLDTIYATLRQGQPDADINISGSQGDRGVRFDMLPGSGVGTAENLAERYGSQPGDGSPPNG